MKTIISFFVAIWNWIVGLFKSSPKAVVHSKHIPSSEVRKERARRSGPMIPAHNNRKSKKNDRGAKSRFTQYIQLKNGTTRAIYHTIVTNG